jgi:lipopolysaccharide transport system ATP-binding protein
MLSKGEKRTRDFWALQDINFKIEAGERVGIIGRNGAGKSTLLKILSRVTWPTTGEAIIRGRLSSLLEVGTGFHPELSGRENIYLNGSVLGLKKKEIDRQFDAIVDFSGVEAFLETPIKHYSSGMQLRLAFAVAAHLEPEILVIDEVLAVGDLEFQKKCIGKMEAVSKQEGRTILFVSHDLNYVSALCTKAVLLQDGRVAESGKTHQIVSNYISHITKRSAQYIYPETDRPGNDIVKLGSLRVIDASFNAKSNFKVTEKIGIEMKYEVFDHGRILWLGHNIYNQTGVHVFDAHNVNSPYYHEPHSKGKYVSVMWIPAHLLNTGSYYINSAIFNHMEKVIHFHEKDILSFSVYEVFDEITARGMNSENIPGIIRPLLDWTVNKV